MTPRQSGLEQPVLAVDVVAMRVEDGQLLVLLHRRKVKPFRDAWALPGVAVRLEETLEAAARRAIKTKAHLAAETQQQLHLEQLATFDALYRDPRGRTVSTAYLGLLRGNGGVDPTNPDVAWRPANSDPGRLPFDHAEILDQAVQRLRGKLRYTNIAAHLLPRTFRIHQLQQAYEAVLGRGLNRSNFRNKLLRIGLIRRVGQQPDLVGRQGGRPPHVYSFVRDEVVPRERDFL